MNLLVPNKIADSQKIISLVGVDLSLFPFQLSECRQLGCRPFPPLNK